MKIIVIGAGYAGLTATRHLIEAGHEVALWEARERVGGRIFTQQIENGQYADLGGQWIGPTQDRIYALVKEMGLETFGVYNEGKNVLALGGKIKTYAGLIPKMDLFSLLNLDFVLKKLDRLAKNINLEKPWLSPDAKRLDSMTLATFLDRQVWTKAARSVMDAAMETLFAAPAAEISLLHALFYAKSGTSLETLINIDNGAQQDRIKGGAQGPADRLAARFAQHIHFNRELKAVIQDENGVTLVHQNGQERADRVIIAIPPTLAGRIYYSPALSARRDQLSQRVPMGTVIKCYAVYPKAWWREQGMSGQVVADEDFPIQTFFDNSPADGSKGVLMGFSLANRARPLLDKSMAERGEMVRNMLIRCFGPAAGQWEQYFDHSWADETFSRGCYAAVMPPGAWTGFEAALSEPCGRIHWAGTETSPIWNGYIEGAIRSGERAAAEVLGLG